MLDFVLSDHGSVVVLTPVTDHAKAWVDDHISNESQSWCRGVVIEPRYVAGILDGIVEDGLTFA